MTVGHVVLVGLMGAGKTTVGRRVAKALDRPFVDCDEAFVTSTGRTIAEVFATDGEPRFRALEAELVAELLAVPEPTVVATGGGAVLDPRTRAALRAADGPLVVWLRADAAFLAARAKDRAHRPLLAGTDAREVLARLAVERDPLYAEVADEVLDVASFHEWGTQPKKAMAARITALVEARTGGHGSAA